MYRSMKSILLSITALLLPLLLPAQQAKIVYLSGTDAAHTIDWEFYCTDGRNSGNWTTIPVPSNWELEGFGTYNYGHDWKNDKIKLGKEHGLYKYTFQVPAEWKGQVINIVFDGSMTDTEVKINGKPAGTMHQGGFYRFKYDISGLLRYGKANLLEADVAKHSSNESVNRAERQADFWIFGGIYRPVYLEVLPPIHMTRTAINAQADGQIESLIAINDSSSAYSVEMNLYERIGTHDSDKKKQIGPPISSVIPAGQSSAKIVGRFDGVKSWNPEKPALYDLSMTLKKEGRVLHEKTERIGFRTVELREHDGVYVNGSKVIFKGINRHSFWPETGRALSDEHHKTDIRLMKEMNMNAVRMSHYGPDKRFLELCDSMGLFVLDELAGWQEGYDTIVGPRLIKELILKDENHPSVVIWDHGNEGGWDFTNEKWFHHYDIQKRPVIYPWLLRNGMDTHHYPSFQYGINRIIRGNAPFMATEFMHGLYDGGHGAGLESYWRAYESSPLLAGAFLWVLADEAVLRTDKPGRTFDSDGDHGPDGILGPHREKEGSFYTVKEIWSPVQIKPVSVNPAWDGKLYLENKFIYTDLSECSFSWAAYRMRVGEAELELLDSAVVESPACKPGETAMLYTGATKSIATADLFTFTARDPQDNELYTWSWPLNQPVEIVREWKAEQGIGTKPVEVVASGNQLKSKASGMEFVFNLKDGTLQSVRRNNQLISFSGGPRPAGIESVVTDVSWKKGQDGSMELTVLYDKFPFKATWRLYQNGLLYLETESLHGRLREVDFIGISFDYPEKKCESITWMGRGPYRVWKNRTKGSNIGVWKKAYNNTITGESFENLIYPEFKGYHGNLYWALLETTESPFTILTETPGLYFHLFTPENPAYHKGGTIPPFPEGNLSFLYEIPAIGTKFQKAEELGPGSQKGIYGSHKGDLMDGIKLWFDFR